jgi:hypothetical protein
VKIFFLLVVLTQNGAGDINASFVNTETLEQCQQKASMLEGVFIASNIPVVESRCLQSSLRFSKFGHASTSSQIRNFYLVKVNDAVIQVESMPDWSACMVQAKQDSGSDKIYCSSSVQSLEK